MDWNATIKDIELFIEGLPQGLVDVVWGAVRIALLLLAARYAGRLISLIALKLMAGRSSRIAPEHKKRFDTISTLLHSVLRYGLYFVAIAMALDIIGVGNAFATLLATAGIGGLAIGFGAQSLVKDVVTGCFLLFENHYGVGDLVEIAGITGTVKAVAIRVTYLVGKDGETVSVPNGSISTVKNFSRSRALSGQNAEENGAAQ